MAGFALTTYGRCEATTEASSRQATHARVPAPACGTLRPRGLDAGEGWCARRDNERGCRSLALRVEESPDPDGCVLGQSRPQPSHMRALSTQGRAAIAAVAREFSAAWQVGAGPDEAYFTVAGKRIIVKVICISGRPAGFVPNPRLRFDKVALGFVRRLRAGLHEAVPDGVMVVLTITAPIRQDSKTATLLEHKLRVLLAARSARAQLTDTIHGNRIRVRIMKGCPNGSSKLAGFVHNPDSDPAALFGVTRSLLACIGRQARTPRPAGFARDRWLVIANQDGLLRRDTYRHLSAQLGIPTGFKQVLMVLPGGRVERVTA